MNDEGFEVFTGVKHALMIEGMVVAFLFAAFIVNWRAIAAMWS